MLRARWARESTSTKDVRATTSTATPISAAVRSAG